MPSPRTASRSLMPRRITRQQWPQPEGLASLPTAASPLHDTPAGIKLEGSGGCRLLLFWASSGFLGSGFRVLGYGFLIAGSWLRVPGWDRPWSDIVPCVVRGSLGKGGNRLVISKRLLVEE
eukprot:scaffold481_cov238-Pinguiococcus_pyrenoidosus.AAC.9